MKSHVPTLVGHPASTKDSVLHRNQGGNMTSLPTGAPRLTLLLSFYFKSSVYTWSIKPRCSLDLGLLVWIKLGKTRSTKLQLADK